MRKTKRSPELESEILELLGEGIPLEEILRSGSHMPSQSAWNMWCREDPELHALWVEAKQQGFDRIAADCLKIADDGRNDWMESNDPVNPGYKINGEHIQRSKLRVDTRFKLLSKWYKKKYGDSVEVSGDAANPLTVVLSQLGSTAMPVAKDDDAAETAIV